MTLLEIARICSSLSIIVHAVLLPGRGPVGRCVPETDNAELDKDLTDMNTPEMVNEELLTTRQTQCLQLIAAGKTSGTISSMLCISESTVNFHLKNVLTKLHANNRTHAVAKALSLSLIQPL